MEWQFKTLCILVISLVYIDENEGVNKEHTFYALPDLDMPSFMSTFNRSNDVQCGISCLHNDECLSFGITASTGVCKLFDTDPQVAASNSITVTGSIIYIKGCEKGWLIFDNSCYKFTTTSKSWVQSKTYCESLGASLAIVTYEEEHQFIRQTVVGRGKPYFWIGGRYNATAGGYRWIDGTEITFNGWRPGLPVGGSGCLDYLGIANWLWNHHGNCYSTYGACICEKKRI